METFATDREAAGHPVSRKPVSRLLIEGKAMD